MQGFCWIFAAFQCTDATSSWMRREQIPRDQTHWEQTMQGVAAALQHQTSPIHQRCAASDTSSDSFTLRVLHL